MQKYKIYDIEIPQERRETINKKILGLISAGDLQSITPEDIFNSYTGIGGLHGLKREDFSSYHAYSQAKKEIEQGQFFTPHDICRGLVEMLKPNSAELMADITCGIGNFFNYFQEENCFGMDTDRQAVEVAKLLYPNATITAEDFRYFKVENKVDYVLGNPPFNLSLTHPDTGSYVQSQFFFFEKSAQIMKPGGILLAIVPESFLQDEFFNKSNIEDIKEHFDFIGQYKLPAEAFKQMGVKKFATKVVCFQRKAEATANRPYKAKFCTPAEMQARLDEVQKEREVLRHRLKQELIQSEDKTFEFKVRKYLYEIRTQKSLKKYLGKALAHLDKLKNQKCPDGMEFNDWYRHHRITEPMTLSYLKKIIAKQSYKPIDKVEFVKTNYGFKLKAYSDKAKNKLNHQKIKSWKLTEIVAGLDMSYVTHGYKWTNFVARKKYRYQVQGTAFSELKRNPEIDNYLRRFTFKNKEGKTCQFNKIQRHDLGLILQKDYSILAWQQGGGKSAGALAWAKHKPMKNTFIVSTALAINLTWREVLKVNNIKFIQPKSIAEIESIQPGDFVLLSFEYLTKYERHLKKYIKQTGGKINFLFDESDEITNSTAKRTKTTLNLFRRVKRKLLTTGTTTRNNIGEIYSQLETLYNNSVNMMSFSQNYYIEEYSKEDGISIKKRPNKYYNQPFPAYYGQTVFRRCFNPSKSTVFGIQRQNQDIYNEPDLRALIEKTIITRKFREIAGDKYGINNVLVRQDNAEIEVYKTIIRELDTIIPAYYNSTGNDRKNSMLRMMRQLQLLIEATSTPQLFSFYKGSGISSKAKKIFELIGDYNGKIAIGCTSLDGVSWYAGQIRKLFPDRELFEITGDVNFGKRGNIIDRFEATEDGILICTQQSLKSSINIPTCDKVIVESLQWNIPKIEQFFFRFIRYDSKNRTEVVFVNYEGTIEVNLLALLMAKEKLNDYIKTLEYRENSDIYDEYDIDLDILNQLITKQKEEDGSVKIQWGEAQVTA